MNMIDQKDYDQLAQEMGYQGGMKEVREKRLAKIREAELAKAAAEELAIRETIKAEEAGKDNEINSALSSGRMIIKINEQVYLDVKDYHQIVCPVCQGDLPQIRETCLCVKRRGTLKGELKLPEWYRAASSMLYDTIPCGSGDGLLVYSQNLLATGKGRCPHCDQELNISAQIAVEHDGQRLPDLWGL